MRRYLLISPNPPYPTQSGANQRTFLLFKALQELGHVDLVLITDEGYNKTSQEILPAEFNHIGNIAREFGPFAPQAFLPTGGKFAGAIIRLIQTTMGWRYSLSRSIRMSKKLASFVATGEYDAIIARYLSTATQTGAISNTRLYIDLDDLESEIWRSRSTATRKAPVAWMYRTISRSYRLKERELTAQCQGVWVAKAADARELPRVRATILPNIPLASYPNGVNHLPPPDSENIILGVGVYDWLPNKQGFDWFIRSVWPRIHEHRPEAELHLVGKLSDREMAGRWASIPGIKVLGRVDDLRAEYQKALLTIAPISSGGGTNIKVVESLAYGRCCVALPHAAKGLSRLPGLYTVGDAAEFSTKCLELLGSSSTAIQSGVEASIAANRSYSYYAFSEAVRGTIDLRDEDN